MCGGGDGAHCLLRNSQVLVDAGGVDAARL